jgi:hypothetical protein
MIFSCLPEVMRLNDRAAPIDRRPAQLPADDQLLSPETDGLANRLPIGLWSMKELNNRLILRSSLQIFDL